MTLTRYGLREWLTASAAALILLALFTCAGILLSRWFLIGDILTALLWVAAVGFFRNPSRKLPEEQDVLLSPADGTVRDIGIVNFPEAPFEGRALRIGIFLSVLNVHLNRAPARWAISSRRYRPGRYLDARNPECAGENEAMTLGGTAFLPGREFPMAVRQISGAIARRIVCPPDAGDEIPRGAVYGMIKFGSRTELYLPETGFAPAVKIGDKVRAGLTILARPAPEGAER